MPWMLPWPSLMCMWVALTLSLYVAGAAEDRPEVDPRFMKAVENMRAEDPNYRRLAAERKLLHNQDMARTSTEIPPRHKSVWWWWEASDGITADINAWYMTAEVTARGDDSFFAINGHKYGYFGIQAYDMVGGKVAKAGGERDMLKGKVIFSIWDQLCKGDDMDACPEDKQVQVEECCDICTCMRFGGEGTGGKSFFWHNTWTLDTAYSFLTTAEPMPDNQVRFKGYFYDAVSGWKVMGAFVVNRAEKDWVLYGQYSFVEQWANYGTDEKRWAKFGPCFARRGFSSTDLWDPVYRGKYYYDDEVRANEDETHINAEENANGKQWEMGIGGDIVNAAEPNHRFQLSNPDTECPQNLKDIVYNESIGILVTAAPPLSITSDSRRLRPGTTTALPPEERMLLNLHELENTATTGQILDLDGLVPGILRTRQLSTVPSLPPLAKVACHDATTSTPTTARKVVVVEITVANLDYTSLSADAALMSSVGSAAGEAIAAEAGPTGNPVAAKFVNVTASEGNEGTRRLCIDMSPASRHRRLASATSLKATITPPATTNSSEILRLINKAADTESSGTLAADLVTALTAVSGVSAATSGGTLAVTISKVTIEAILVNTGTDAKTYYFMWMKACAAKHSPLFLLTLLLYCWADG